ncbi:hypothetical protein [Micromonospora sp. KC213]|uniref:hypothetical protein n=1 Tax=Micromonospora sp. KC213 TaxID=2530378 RepID=UPI001FB84C68|nr:hypothetical protein [Micromonospora sp. KC213]
MTRRPDSRAARVAVSVSSFGDAHPASCADVAECVRVREIDDDEGRRLLRIIRRDSASVVTWHRAQMVLLSAQSMPVAKTAVGRTRRQAQRPRP